MNDFCVDNSWQQGVRDRILVPQFYESTKVGRYVLMDKGRIAEIVQRRMAVDTIVQKKDGGVVAIEEKIVRWPGFSYSCYALETESCTVEGHESDGWMRYAEADYLLYCFQQEDAGHLVCHLIDFQELRAWFAPIEDTFSPFQMTTRNRTRGRIVPIADVRKVVKVWVFTLRAAVSEVAA